VKITHGRQVPAFDGARAAGAIGALQLAVSRRESMKLPIDFVATSLHLDWVDLFSM
jgi:glycerate kinase